MPLPVTLPKQAFKWNVPSSRAGVSNLEPPQVRPRPDFLAPVDVTNVAMNKPVTASMDPPAGLSRHENGKNAGFSVIWPVYLGFSQNCWPIVC